MQYQRVPQHDDQRAVFLRIPAPEAAPGVVGPQTSEHRPKEAEQDGKAQHAVDYAGHLSAELRRERRRQHAAQHVIGAQQTGRVRCGVTERDAHDVRGQPELRIEDRLHDGERISLFTQKVGHQQRQKAGHRPHHVPHAVAVDHLDHKSEQHRSPRDEDRRGVQVGDRGPTRNVNPRNQTEGVQGEGEHDEPIGGPFEVTLPADPTRRRQNERKQVQPRRPERRRKVVVVRLEADLHSVVLGGIHLRQRLGVLVQMPVEGLGVPIAVRPQRVRQGDGDRVGLTVDLFPSENADHSRPKAVAQTRDDRIGDARPLLGGHALDFAAGDRLERAADVLGHLIETAHGQPHRFDGGHPPVGLLEQQSLQRLEHFEFDKLPADDFFDAAVIAGLLDQLRDEAVDRGALFLARHLLNPDPGRGDRQRLPWLFVVFDGDGKGDSRQFAPYALDGPKVLNPLIGGRGINGRQAMRLANRVELLHQAVQLEDPVLEGAQRLLALFIDHLTSQLQLFAKLLALALDFLQRVAQSLAARQAERIEHVEVLDAEHLMLFGIFAVGHHVEQPDDGRFRDALLRETEEHFFGFSIIRIERLLFGKRLQRTAGQRVERLDPAVRGNRHAAEAIHVRLALVGRGGSGQAAHKQHKQNRDGQRRSPARHLTVAHQGRLYLRIELFAFGDCVRPVVAVAARRCGSRCSAGGRPVPGRVRLRLDRDKRRRARGSAAIQESTEHHHKMEEHSRHDDHASDVRNHPTRILHDRQRGDLGPVAVPRIAALVKRLARVPQRVVHPDDGIAIDVAAFVDQADFRPVILRCRRADVMLGADIFQRDGVRLVDPLRPKLYVPCIACDRYRLRVE